MSTTNTTQNKLPFVKSYLDNLEHQDKVTTVQKKNLLDAISGGGDITTLEKIFAEQIKAEEVGCDSFVDFMIKSELYHYYENSEDFSKTISYPLSEHIHVGTLHEVFKKYHDDVSSDDTKYYIINAEKSPENQLSHVLELVHSAALSGLPEAGQVIYSLKEMVDDSDFNSPQKKSYKEKIDIMRENYGKDLFETYRNAKKGNKEDFLNMD